MSAATTEPRSPAPEATSHLRVYVVIGAVVLILVILGLLLYNGAQDDQEAQAKADQLTKAFGQAGLAVPVDTDQIVASLGADGGAVCENPANALGKATLADSLTNGASFVGRRAVVIDKQVLQGEAVILKTYCPDELQAYQDKIDQLKSDDTIEP
jgi:hypothetical protein